MSTLLLVMALSCGQAAAESSPATLTVHLPSAARLFVNDVRAQSTGPTRTLATPPLEPGYDYFYQVRVELDHAGKKLEASKKVLFRAGQNIVADFRAVEPQTVVAKSSPAASTDTSAKPALTDNTKGILEPEREMMELINKFRAEHNLPALKFNPLLCHISRKHCETMGRLRQLGHVLEGKGPGERCRDAGYTNYAGENCAGGSKGAAQTFMQLWIDSPGHRQNMLGPWSEMGVGFARTADGRDDYWTTLFGRGATD